MDFSWVPASGSGWQLALAILGLIAVGSAIAIVIKRGEDDDAAAPEDKPRPADED